MNRLIYLSMFLYANVNSATSGESGNKNGVISDVLAFFIDQFKLGFTTIAEWFLIGLFSILSPIIIYGCKTIIVWSFVILFCSNSSDNKSIATALKCFIVYILFLMIRSAIL